MTIWEKLFGKWEKVISYSAVVQYLHLWHVFDEEVIITIEKNSKTTEYRAELERSDGRTESVSVSHALNDLRKNNAEVYKKYFGNQ